MDIRQKEYRKDRFGSSKLVLEFKNHKDITYQTINSIRKVCSKEIPTYAFHHSKINITRNNSVFDNDEIRLYLSQLPIPNINHDVDILSVIYYKDINFKDPNIIKHPNDKINIEYFIKAKNDTTSPILDITTNDLRININGEFMDVNKMYSKEYPIPLIELRSGEEFECNMKAVLSIGENHSIFNSAHCYHREIKENEYELIIESSGQMTEYEILERGINILIKKFENIKENIKNNQYTGKDNTKLIKSNNNNNEIIGLFIDNEDHTCGGPINYFLQNSEKILFSGVNRPEYAQKSIFIEAMGEKNINIMEEIIKACEKSMEFYKNILNIIKKINKKSTK
jgi:DNA-directed RNA polymerase subunit L